MKVVSGTAPAALASSKGDDLPWDPGLPVSTPCPPAVVAGPVWAPRACKHGVSCWRPACPFLHEEGNHRFTVVRDLAAHWAQIEETRRGSSRANVQDMLPNLGAPGVVKPCPGTTGSVPVGCPLRLRLSLR